MDSKSGIFGKAMPDNTSEITRIVTESVPDQYRKVVLSMDGFDFSRDGDEHIHLPDFILFDQVGPVEAERFFYILNRDNFDYTEWQKGLFADETAGSLAEKIKAFKPRRIRLTSRQESGYPTGARKALQRVR